MGEFSNSIVKQKTKKKTFIEKFKDKLNDYSLCKSIIPGHAHFIPMDHIFYDYHFSFTLCAVLIMRKKVH